MPRPSTSGNTDWRDAAAGKGRWTLSGWLGLATLAGVVLFYLGCSTPEARYRVLSLFFDGVPPPPGMKVVLPEWAKSSADIEADLQRFAATQPGAPTHEEPKNYMYHQPYIERRCTGCHNPEVGFQPMKPDADLCQKCHRNHIESEPDDWVHGPTGLGLCSQCHLPHKSEFPGLLIKAQPELCFRCHEASFVETDPFHRTLQDRTCSNCHDPHAAGNRLLLADSRTYQWRQHKVVEVKIAHRMWTKDDCAKCHVIEESNRLRDDVNSVCLTCHTTIKEVPAGQTLHEAVLKNKCVICHHPHGTRRPYLIRETAEQICFKCHKIEDIRKPGHPNVTRVDCTLCHLGHTSPEPHMLRANIMAMGRTGFATTAPADEPESAPTTAPDATPTTEPAPSEPPEPPEPPEPAPATPEPHGNAQPEARMSP